MATVLTLLVLVAMILTPVGLLAAPATRAASRHESPCSPLRYHYGGQRIR
ncbi:hypothetical protein BH09ACT7_BH09ACT7_18840 [soil metagenome]